MTSVKGLKTDLRMYTTHTHSHSRRFSVSYVLHFSSGFNFLYSREKVLYTSIYECQRIKSYFLSTYVNCLILNLPVFYHTPNC